MKYIKIASLLIFWLGISYLALTFQDAAQNVSFVRNLVGPTGLWVVNIFLVFFLSGIALMSMDHVVGSEGLGRVKKLYAHVFLAGTPLLFAFSQFFNALATSSAEGATVAVEVWRQVVWFFKTGNIEQYGLVGMLTSDASGPWNHSIFPMVFLGYFMIKGKKLTMSVKHLSVSMFFMTLLYAEQFFFSLNYSYNLIEVLIMLGTSSAFVIGMFSFLLSLFKEVGLEEEDEEETERKGVWGAYVNFLDDLAYKSFKIFNWDPWDRKVDKALTQKTYKPLSLGKTYFLVNGVQLIVFLTVSMLALMFSLQFMFHQFGMADAEASLFGAAGVTSMPEAFVAFSSGPIITILMYVGSNIIDGWLSAIGQTFLIGFVSAFKGYLVEIPLAHAITHLTFLSWTQGMMTWLLLWWWGKRNNINPSFKMNSLALIGLLVLNIYYFYGAWLSAQAIGLNSSAALANPFYQWITHTINLFAS